MTMLGTCNCGKPIRYMHNKNGVGSCNKYLVCKTYDELLEELDHYKGLSVVAQNTVLKVKSMIKNFMPHTAKHKLIQITMNHDDQIKPFITGN